MMTLLLACTTEPVTPPPEVIEPAEPALSVVPDGPTPPSESEALRPPPTSPGGQLVRIEAMRRRCEVDCDRLLSSAGSSGKPVESREVLWWALSAAEVSDEVRGQIEAAAADIAAAPKPLWRPMAASLAHSESGRQTLSGLMKTGEEVELRAAAACAMLSELPVESWRDHDLDAAAMDAMGMCVTPWRSGQQTGDAPG